MFLSLQKLTKRFDLISSNSRMYSVKVGWVGQTFALAAGNDSAGKKSRIRRSKEERKTMIESFIKRYQCSNNGEFPSLKRTHKEVGGSYYIVREIVREIIQENRVLGPGHSSLDEQKDDDMVVNYPLGSIASEPQGVMFQKANQMNVLSRQEGDEIVVLNIDNNGQYITQFDWDAVQHSTEHHTEETGEDTDSSPTSENVVKSENSEQGSLEVSLNGTDNVQFVNHMQTNVLYEDSDKKIVDVSPLQANLTLPTEEVKVETFPLRPTIKEPDGLGSTSTNSGDFDGASNDFEGEKVKISISNSSAASDKVGSVDSLATKGTDSSEVSVSSDSGESPAMMTQHAEVSRVLNQHGEVSLKNDAGDNSYSSAIKDDTEISHAGVNQISLHNDSTLKTIEQNNLQPKNNLKGSTDLNSSDATSCNNGQEPTAANGNEYKRDDKVKFGKTTPLDRIDLGSWKASKQETNPLQAFFKPLIDAIAKFWS